MTGSPCTLTPDWSAYLFPAAVAVSCLIAFLAVLFSGKKLPRKEAPLLQDEIALLQWLDRTEAPLSPQQIVVADGLVRSGYLTRSFCEYDGWLLSITKRGRAALRMPASSDEEAARWVP